MAVGYVYLMTNGKDYKIGLTASEPQSRQRQLQTGNSERIDLIAYTICTDMNGLESKLHRLFAPKRKSGEWFDLDEHELHKIYNIFKKESINLDMSCIPEIIDDNIDTLMKSDAKRLSNGEKILYEEKYKHISNHKEIIIQYMLEEDERKKIAEVDLKQKIKEENTRKEYLYTLMKEDAEQIAQGKKPQHTFEYQVLDDWKYILEYEIQQINKKWVEEDIYRMREGLDPLHNKKFGSIEEWKGLIEAEIGGLGNINNEDYEAIIKGEKPPYNYMYENFDEWKNKLQILQEQKELQARNYIDKDAKRIMLDLKPIYQEYYVDVLEDWEDTLNIKNILAMRKEGLEAHQIELENAKSHILNGQIDLNHPEIKRDRNTYVATVLERKKNKLQPPKYESYFQGNFADNLDENRKKNRGRMMTLEHDSYLDNYEKYLSRVLGEGGQKKAKLIKMHAIEEYNKYILKHKKFPFGEIKFEEETRASLNNKEKTLSFNSFAKFFKTH